MTTMNLISDGESFTLQREESGIYRVHQGGRMLGFVERAGSVYVALAGPRYDRAVESGQAHSLGRAAALLRATSMVAA